MYPPINFYLPTYLPTMFDVSKWVHELMKIKSKKPKDYSKFVKYIQTKSFDSLIGREMTADQWNNTLNNFFEDLPDLKYIHQSGIIGNNTGIVSVKNNPKKYDDVANEKTIMYDCQDTKNAGIKTPNNSGMLEAAKQKQKFLFFTRTKNERIWKLNGLGVITDTFVSIGEKTRVKFEIKIN